MNPYNHFIHAMMTGLICVAAAMVFAPSALRAEAVKLTTSSSSSSAYISGGVWSDGAAPSSGKDYVVADGLTLTLDAADSGSAFPGGSLSIGDGSSAGTLAGPASANKTYSFGRLDLRAGSITVNGGGGATTLSGPVGILSSSSSPFLLTGRADVNSSKYQLTLPNAVSGAADAALRIAPSQTSAYLHQQYGFQCQLSDLSAYAGKLIVEGPNTYLFFSPTANYAPPTLLGMDGGELVADALTLRNGGAILFNSSKSFTFESGNRGIRVEGEKGGRIIEYYINTVEPLLDLHVTGDGPLHVESARGGKCFWLDGKVACAALVAITNAQSSGSCVVKPLETFELGEDTDLVVSCATFVVPVKGMSPRRTVLDGCKIVAAVGRPQTSATLLTRYTASGSETVRRPNGGGVGCLHLAEGSEIRNTPIRLDIENAVPPPSAQGFKVLTVPLSVKALSAGDFDAGTRPVTIETENGVQSVYIGAPESSCTYVVPAGTAGNTPAAPYATWATAANDIQSAINAATAGGIVRIAPGTYAVSTPLELSKAVRLASDDGSGREAPETTILDGGGANRILTTSGNNVVFLISGLTFRNGYSDSNGGAILLNANFVPTSVAIANCIFKDNVALGMGGAVAAASTTATVIPRIVDCLFTNNVSHVSSNGGGALAVAASGTLEDRNCLTVTGCRFVDNLSVGGAAFVNYALFEDCSFAGNAARVIVDSRVSRANGRGSGMAAVSSGNNVVFHDCVFTGNTGGSVANGAHLRSMFSNNVCGTLLEGNNANIFLECVDSTVSGNTVDSLLSQVLPVGRVFRNCLFSDNVSTGILLPVNPSYKRFRVFENCTFAGNEIRGSLFSVANAPASVTDCGVTMTNTIFWGNAVQTAQTYANVLLAGGANCSDNALVQDMTAAGLLTRNPKFSDAVRGDYTLLPNSPCREKALSLPWMDAGSTDLAGNPRVADLFGRAFAPGALPDIGCYECMGHKALETLILLQ